MATLHDLSALTGLSISTISKYLNGGSLRKYNVEKIEAALKEIDYQPNLLARSLKTKKTNVYGILIPNLQSSFDINFVSVIINELSQKGYGTILSLYENEKKEAEMFSFLRNKQVDGIVILPSGKYKKVFDDFINEGKHLVLIDRPVENLNANVVLTNNYEVSCAMIQRLINVGHRNIAIMTNSKLYTGAERLRAYKDTLKKNSIKINPAYIKESLWTIQAGRKLMNNILDEEPEVTAVFVCSEEFAMGCYQILNERGFSIPKDISIVSFDLYGVASMISPSISTIQQPLEKMGRCVVDLLLSDEKETRKYIFPSKITSENTILSLATKPHNS